MSIWHNNIPDQVVKILSLNLPKLDTILTQHFACHKLSLRNRDLLYHVQSQIHDTISFKHVTYRQDTTIYLNQVLETYHGTCGRTHTQRLKSQTKPASIKSNNMCYKMIHIYTCIAHNVILNYILHTTQTLLQIIKLPLSYNSLNWFTIPYRDTYSSSKSIGQPFLVGLLPYCNRYVHNKMRLSIK